MRARCRAGRVLAALLCVASGTALAAPEDQLLAEFAGEFREPQRRCAWAAGHFDSIERRLSLYREELSTIRVTVDGVMVGDSASGAVQLLAFESRLVGPASVAITLDQRRANALDRLKPGRRIDISFTDRAGRTHAMFCGPAAIVQADAATLRTVVVALIPRLGKELRSSAKFLNQTCVQTLVQVAADAGLGADQYLQRSRKAVAETVRDSQATWPFMRQLAWQCGLELVLKSDGRFAITEANFAAPSAPAARSWTQLSWVDIARQLASNQGRTTEARLTSAYPRITVAQTVDDDAFLLDVSIAARASAWYMPGKLLLAEDGLWSTMPPAPVLPSGASDLLLKRVVVTGSAGSQRSFTRRVADARIQSQDPERIPAVEAALLLGSDMPAATLPAMPLADGARIASALDAVLVRLDGQAGDTAERRFLRDLVRVHRPTLHHLYRLRPDGAPALEAIGR